MFVRFLGFNGNLTISGSTAHTDNVGSHTRNRRDTQVITSPCFNGMFTQVNTQV